jgi:Ca2+:H+ antiporter
LVSAIEDVTEEWGISETFVGLILLPIVGNAAEHLTAVTCALKNKVQFIECKQSKIKLNYC